MKTKFPKEALVVLQEWDGECRVREIVGYLEGFGIELRDPFGAKSVQVSWPWEISLGLLELKPLTPAAAEFLEMAIGSIKRGNRLWDLNSSLAT